MKLDSPRSVALSIALVVSVIIFIALLLLAPPAEYTMWLIYIVVILTSFLLVYRLASYMLNRFFIRVLYPIYKTIRTLNFSTEELEEELESPGYNLKLQDDVNLWAKEKTKQIAQLRQMEKYRKEFLGDVSHELKTPIFTIQGYISTLIDGGLHDPSINMKYLERTEKSINRMISIVEDLISISQLESGELLLHKETFNIKTLVEEIIEAQEMSSKNRHVSLKIKKSNESNYEVRADRKMIYQVMLNLIVNSVNYGKDGGQTEIAFHNIGQEIMVEVSDNGIGIAKADIDRIFERFYRADKSHSKETGGTGLGLAICKHIMEAHQKKITVESELGKGSTFSFILDRAY